MKCDQLFARTALWYLFTPTMFTVWSLVGERPTIHTNHPAYIEGKTVINYCYSDCVWINNGTRLIVAGRLVLGQSALRYNKGWRREGQVLWLMESEALIFTASQIMAWAIIVNWKLFYRFDVNDNLLNW